MQSAAFVLIPERTTVSHLVLYRDPERNMTMWGGKMAGNQKPRASVKHAEDSCRQGGDLLGEQNNQLLSVFETLPPDGRLGYSEHCWDMVLECIHSTTLYADSEKVNMEVFQPL